MDYVKKKAVILSVADLRHMTCSNFFCEYLNNNRIAFDIICMNRYEERAASAYECGLYQYNCLLSTDASAVNKFSAFFKFRRYANEIIKKNHYDVIIVWGENAAWLFGKTLKEHGDYCINIRDKLIGKSILFAPILKSVMKKALFCTYPTPEKADYLGVPKLVMLNKDYQVIKNYRKEKKLHRKAKVITITYMGVIPSYMDTFKKMLEVFKNDSRFLLVYYGAAADTDLKAYAQQQGITNAKFGGAFPPEKTSGYLEETNIINSVYGNENEGVPTGVGVKESYAPLLHIPVLSDKNCFFANLSEQYGFGKGVQITKQLPDEVYEWYSALDEDIFDKGCDEYCSWVDGTNSKIEKALDETFKKGGKQNE